MNIKSAEKMMWGTAAAFLAVRVLQYIFAIGKDGFFIGTTLFQNILANALYVLFGIFVVLSLFVCFGKQNQNKGSGKFLCSSAVAWTSLINAFVLAVYAAVLCFDSNWLCLLLLAAASYFILLYFYAKGRELPVMKYMALGALGYPCARAIQMFFDTFKEIKASENVIDMVAVCAMILMILALTKACMGFEEKTGKLAWSLLVFGTFGALSGIGKLFGLIWMGAADLTSVVSAISDAVMWGTTLVIYHALATFRAPENTDQQEQSV